MPKLTIVANIVATPDKVDLLRDQLAGLVSITRAEEGCIQYDLHQDNDDPARFLFYETWESRALWQNHMNAPHLAAYKKATEGSVAEFTLHEMSLID